VCSSLTIRYFVLNLSRLEYREREDASHAWTFGAPIGALLAEASTKPSAAQLSSCLVHNSSRDELGVAPMRAAPVRGAQHQSTKRYLISVHSAGKPSRHVIFLPSE
jgi:hypothetical protein